MRFLTTHFIAFCVGASAMALFSSPGRSPTDDAPKVLRTYYDAAQTMLESECPLDASGKMHGHARYYWRSGALKSVLDMHHGQIGRGILEEHPDVEAQQ